MVPAQARIPSMGYIPFLMDFSVSIDQTSDSENKLIFRLFYRILRALW